MGNNHAILFLIWTSVLEEMSLKEKVHHIMIRFLISYLKSVCFPSKPFKV